MNWRGALLIFAVSSILRIVASLLGSTSDGPWYALGLEAVAAGGFGLGSALALGIVKWTL